MIGAGAFTSGARAQAPHLRGLRRQGRETAISSTRLSVLCTFTLYFMLSPVAWSQPGSVDTNFNGSLLFHNATRTVAVQSDGLILVGGEFRTGDGSPGNYVTRLQPDGTVDPQFNPGDGPDVSVSAFALQPDGKVLIGGGFFHVSGLLTVGVARLNADGTVDTNFVSALNSVSTSPRQMALQADGKVLVTDSAGLFRLLPNGALDPDFQPLLSYQLLTNVTETFQFTSVKALPDGTILVGGLFSTNGSPYGGLLRLTTNGLLDPTFSAPIPAVDAFAVKGDGTLMVSVNETNSYNVHQLIHLNHDGSLNLDFQPTVALTGNVSNVKIQADGRTLVAGFFRQAGDLRRVGLARFNTDGSLDQGMDPGFDDSTQVMDLALQTDQKILLAGYLNWPGVSTTRYLARLLNDSTQSAGRLEFARGSFRIPENAGSLVVPVFRVGGTNGAVSVRFTTTPGMAAAGIQYTPQSGTLVFAAGQISNAFTVAVFDDHIVQTNEQNQTFGLQLTNASGGATLGSQNQALVTIADRDTALQFAAPVFSALEVDGVANITVARLGFADSTVSVQYSTADGTATAGIDYSPQSGLLTLGPGEIFKSFSLPLLQDSFVSAVETVRLSLQNPGGGARLGSVSNATLRIVEAMPGVVGAAFVPGTNISSVTKALPQADGKILIIANIWQPEEYYAQEIVRLNPDGKPDPTYNSGWLSGTIFACALQPDGKLLVGGYGLSNQQGGWGNFVRLNQDGSIDGSFSVQGPSTIFSIIVQPDGKIVVRSQWASVLRLNSDGSPDNSFAVIANGGMISQIVLETNGQFLISGTFTQVNGVDRAGIARLQSDGSLDPSFTPAVPFPSWSQSAPPSVYLQSDGKILVEGWMLTNASQSTLLLMRVNHDGSVDSGFATNDTGYINTTGPGFRPLRALQAENKLLLAQEDGSIIRINADGTPDNTFNSGIAPDNAYLTSLDVTADGSVLVSGSFHAVDGISRPGLALLTNDGHSSAGAISFATNLFSATEGLNAKAFLTVRRSLGSNGVVSVDYGVSGGSAVSGVNFIPVAGTIVFGDGDTQDKQIPIGVLDNGLADGDHTIRVWLANPLGGTLIGPYAEAALSIVDHDANIGLATNRISAFQNQGTLEISVARRGRLQEAFSVNYTTTDGSAVALKDYLASSGTLFFAPGQTNQVISITVLDNHWPGSDHSFGLSLSNPSGGATLVDASNATVKIVNAYRPGVLDWTLDLSASLSSASMMVGEVDATLALPDGRFYVAGEFQGTNAYPVNGVARFLPEGQLDPAFQFAAITDAGLIIATGIRSLLVQSDGKLLVAGNGGGGFVQRLNSDGTPDNSFTASVTQFHSVNFMAQQTNGQIVIAGESMPLGFPGVTQPMLARLNSNGSTDPFFSPSQVLMHQFVYGGQIRGIQLQQDQRLLVVGYFMGLTNQFRSGLVRLLSDGQIDSSFSSGLIFQGGGFTSLGFDGLVTSEALQPDGKLLVGGNFSVADGQTRHALARFNTDGSLDAAFNTGQTTWSAISGIALQPDGRIIVVGYLAGQYSYGSSIGRFNADGSLDAFFDSSGFVGPTSIGIAGITVLTNADVLVNGAWFSMDGLMRNGAARLQGGDVLGLESIKWSTDGTTTLWFTTPVNGARLEWSSDFAIWLPVTTNTFSKGYSSFQDAGAFIPRRFYRLRYP